MRIHSQPTSADSAHRPPEGAGDTLGMARALKTHLVRFGRREPHPGSVIGGRPVGRWWHETILPRAHDLDEETLATVCVAGVDPRLPGRDDERSLLEALAYISENPLETAPPAAWVSPSGRRVGAWLLERAEEAREGRLGGDLEILRTYGLLVPLRSLSFEHLLDDLDEHIRLHGHARVAAGHVSADGHRIGERLAHEIGLAKAGQLDDEKTMALMRRGVSWEAAAPVQRSRQTWFTLLRQFLAEHDGVPPKAHEKYFGAGLGRWLSAQHSAARRGAVSTRMREEFSRIGLPLPQPSDSPDSRRVPTGAGRQA